MCIADDFPLRARSCVPRTLSYARPCPKLGRAAPSRLLCSQFRIGITRLVQQLFNTMTVTSRIFSCSYNRRRVRVAPQHHDESTIQTTKQNPLKPRPESHLKLAVVSENAPEWPAVEESNSTPSLDSEANAAADYRSIFRRRAASPCPQEEDSDLFALKRANPVYESDDEEYLMMSPTKRQRTKEPTVIHWDAQLSNENDVTFSLR